MTNLDELEAKAKAATPGPWRPCDGQVIQTHHITRDVWTIPHRDGDMPFIAAINPTVAIALIQVAKAAVAIRGFGSLDMASDHWDLLNDALSDLTRALEGMK